MALYDYHCGEHLTEARRGYEVAEIPCPRCGQPAHRASVYLTANIVESAPVPLSDRRYNVSRFLEASEEISHNHRKAENEQGRELPSPSLYKAGLRRAKATGAPIRA